MFIPVNSPSVIITPRYLGTLSETFNVLLAGGALRISLTDNDLNLVDAEAETVSGIYVTNIMTHQRETGYLDRDRIYVRHCWHFHGCAEHP